MWYRSSTGGAITIKTSQVGDKTGSLMPIYSAYGLGFTVAL